MPPEKRTLGSIGKELIAHPFFPILFIGEFVKQLVENGFGPEYFVLAVIATVLWVLSDVLDSKTVKKDIIGINNETAEE